MKQIAQLQHSASNGNKHLARWIFLLILTKSNATNSDLIANSRFLWNVLSHLFHSNRFSTFFQFIFHCANSNRTVFSFSVNRERSLLMTTNEVYKLRGCHDPTTPPPLPMCWWKWKSSKIKRKMLRFAKTRALE